MPARMGRLSAGVGRRHPVTIRKASLMAGSVMPVRALNGLRQGRLLAMMLLQHPDRASKLPQGRGRVMSTFREVSRYVNDLSNI